MRKHIILTVLLLTYTTIVKADALAELLSQYRSQGAANFSVAAGEKFWESAHQDAKTGETRRCNLCHTSDLRRRGKHATTGKPIDPLAPSANPERLTDKEKIEKWLVRNCKWTVGRECTPQEKGDVLTMIKSK